MSVSGKRPLMEPPPTARVARRRATPITEAGSFTMPSASTPGIHFGQPATTGLLPSTSETAAVWSPVAFVDANNPVLQALRRFILYQIKWFVEQRRLRRQMPMPDLSRDSSFENPYEELPREELYGGSAFRQPYELLFPERELGPPRPAATFLSLVRPNAQWLADADNGSENNSDCPAESSDEDWRYYTDTADESPDNCKPAENNEPVIVKLAEENPLNNCKPAENNEPVIVKKAEENPLNNCKPAENNEPVIVKKAEENPLYGPYAEWLVCAGLARKEVDAEQPEKDEDLHENTKMPHLNDSPDFFVL